MKKALILINENFHQMTLGANATLAYVLATIELGFEAIILELQKNNSSQALHLNQQNCQKLITKFREKNEKIAKNFEKTTISDENIEFLPKKFDFNEIDYVIQRLEPMNPPFPPYGEEKIEDFLQEFSEKTFTKNKKYNLPINCFGDKELPLQFQGVAVETKIHNIGDELEISWPKAIIKPLDLAQGVGIFAIEFDENGLDLGEILAQNAKNLAKKQVFHIKKQNLTKILEILLFLQSLDKENDKKLADFSENEVKSGIKRLYGDKILLQPFIKGVEKGDIRIILAKKDEKFAIFGAIFRKNANFGENFKTGVVSGGAVPRNIDEELTFSEKSDLISKIEQILAKLNGDLAQKYANCYEIGLDFLLFGDGKRVFFNEANHHCQGLVPMAEFFAESDFYKDLKGEKIIVDGGLGVAKNILKNWLS